MEKKVLVVQGDGKRRSALRDALAACGLLVMESNSPAEAMGLVKESRVDGLVIMDEARQLALRGLCGLVRKEGNVPVFVLTNEGSDQMRIASVAGGDAILLPGDASPEDIAISVSQQYGAQGPRAWAFAKGKLVRRSKLWEVHLAKSPSAKADVILTQLTEHFAKDEDLRIEFVESAKPVGDLVHPNLPRVREIGGANDIPFVANDAVAGETLMEIYRRCHKRSQWPSARVAAYVAIELASALECAHAAEILHAAISPESVWITFDGRVQLLYLGVAGYCTPLERTMKSSLGHTAVANVYVAPEQLKNGTPDPRTDIFLTGIILNELLLRQPLTMRDDASAQKNGQGSGPYPPVSDVLSDIALSCLERNPSFRPQSAASLKSKLLAAVEPTNRDGPRDDARSGFLKRIFSPQGSGRQLPAAGGGEPVVEGTGPRAELAAFMRQIA
jgi:DNA-binding NarL/FixJ family response regulator